MHSERWAVTDMVSSMPAGCNPRPHEHSGRVSGIASETRATLRRFRFSMTTTIPIEEDVRDKLRAEKVGSETYSEVIERLIESQQAEA